MIFPLVNSEIGESIGKKHPVYDVKLSGAKGGMSRTRSYRFRAFREFNQLEVDHSVLMARIVKLYSFRRFETQRTYLHTAAKDTSISPNIFFVVVDRIPQPPHLTSEHPCCRLPHVPIPPRR